MQIPYAEYTEFLVSEHPRYFSGKKRKDAKPSTETVMELVFIERHHRSFVIIFKRITQKGCSVV